MRKIGTALLIICIPIFILGACGFTYQFSSPIISELAKYCFISWLPVAIAGFVLVQIAKDIEAKKR
jgi:hypothetical protein